MISCVCFLPSPELLHILQGLHKCFPKKAFSHCDFDVPLQRLGETPKMNMATVVTIFGKFLYLFAISLLLGLIFGLFCSLLLKKFNVPHAPQVRSTSEHFIF